MLILFPLFAYNGLVQTYEFGDIPLLFSDNNYKFFAMALFGAVDMVCSFGFGKLSDHIGRLPIVVVMGVAHIAGFAVLYTFRPGSRCTGWLPSEDACPYRRDIEESNWYFYFIPVTLFAIGDASSNTMVYTITQALFPEDKTAAIANLKFWQSVGLGTAFALSIDHTDSAGNSVEFMSYENKIYMNVILCAGCISLLFSSNAVRKINLPRRNDPTEVRLLTQSSDSSQDMAAFVSVTKAGMDYDRVLS